MTACLFAVDQARPRGRMTGFAGEHGWRWRCEEVNDQGAKEQVGLLWSWSVTGGVTGYKRAAKDIWLFVRRSQQPHHTPSRPPQLVC